MDPALHQLQDILQPFWFLRLEQQAPTLHKSYRLSDHTWSVVLLGNFFSSAILFRLCHRAQTRTAIRKRRRDWEICNLITSFLANIPSTELEACFQLRIIHMQLHKYFDRVKRRKMWSMDSAHYIGSIKQFLSNPFFNTCAAWTFLMYRSHKNILIFIGTLYLQMFLYMLFLIPPSVINL